MYTQRIRYPHLGIVHLWGMVLSSNTMEVFTTNSSQGRLYTDEQHEALEAMENRWRATLPDRTLMAWLDIFPTAIGAAKRGIRTRIKLEKEKLSSLGDYRQTLYEGYVNTAKFKDQPKMIVWLDEHIEARAKEHETEIKRLIFELRRVDNIGNPEPVVSKNGFSEEELARAKAVPIASLIKVGKGKKALCPWHNDRDPSLTVKNNRVWCFPCSRGGDVIDLYMELNRCDMVTAVKALTT